jgi:hypothetical protein
MKYFDDDMYFMGGTPRMQYAPGGVTLTPQQYAKVKALYGSPTANQNPDLWDPKGVKKIASQLGLDPNVFSQGSDFVDLMRNYERKQPNKPYVPTPVSKGQPSPQAQRRMADEKAYEQSQTKGDLYKQPVQNTTVPRSNSAQPQTPRQAQAQPQRQAQGQGQPQRQLQNTPPAKSIAPITPRPAPTTLNSFLQEHGYGTDPATKRQIASSLGLNYTGGADDNIQILKALQKLESSNNQGLSQEQAAMSNFLHYSNRGANTNESIVDYLNSMGMDASKEARKNYARVLGLSDYGSSGVITADDNLRLMREFKRMNNVHDYQDYAMTPMQSRDVMPIGSQMPVAPQEVAPQEYDAMQAGTNNYTRSASGPTSTGSYDFQTEEDAMNQGNEMYNLEEKFQPIQRYGGMNSYYAGGEIENDPHIMSLYGFANGGQIMEIPVAPYGYAAQGMEIPVAPYGYAEMGMMMGDDVTGKSKPSGNAPATPKQLNSQQIANLATTFFSRDPSMQTPLPNFLGGYQLSELDKTLMIEAMKQMKAMQGRNGVYPAITPQMIDGIRPRVEQNRKIDYGREMQRMGGMNYEDGGQMPVDVAVARFKAAGKDKGLSGGQLQMYVEKMKSKYNYQKGGVVKEQELGNYEVGMYGSGGIMYNGTKFPGYNKAINTAPGDKFKKQMLLEKGGKIKLVKFGHR